MIQDIAPHRFDNAFAHRRAPKDTDLVLYYRENTVLIHEGKGDFTFPAVQEIRRKSPEYVSRLIYLFAVDEEAYYLYPGLDLDDLPGCTMVNQRRFREMAPEWRSFAGITGSQLYRWRRGNRYCGRCGGAMRPSPKERALICDECGTVIYPRISPAVIVAVTNGNKLLMSRYKGRPYKHYALIAGFTEFGETIEETVKREVKEEVGLEVDHLRYFASQPWSFSDSVLMGFFADLAGSDEITLEEEELAEAGWFERSEIPPAESLFSLTSTMMEAFREGRENEGIGAVGKVSEPGLQKV